MSRSFCNLNRPFPSCLKPLFESEASCETIDMKMIFICKWMETNRHVKGFALHLVLKQRRRASRKWPIRFWDGVMALWWWLVETPPNTEYIFSQCHYYPPTPPSLPLSKNLLFFAEVSIAPVVLFYICIALHAYIALISVKPLVLFCLTEASLCTCQAINQCVGGSSQKLLSKSRLFTSPDDQNTLMVAAGDESSSSVS